MATNTPQDDWHKTGLRLPKDLHRQLHEAAATSARSYNAEIIERLRASFDDEAGVHNVLLKMLTDQQKQTIDDLQEVVKDLTVELHQLRKAKSK